jgi:phosphoribosylanthranilate isomerase
MLIKICGITNAADALAAIELGANALGFNFYRPSPRYVDPAVAAAIVRELPANVLKVGVFVNESPVAIAREVGLDVAQLHGDESPESLPDFRLWKALRVTTDWTADRANAFAVEALLLDAPGNGLYGGSGETFDWSLIRGVSRPVVLAGGLDGSNVAAAIRAVRPFGVDACSRLESAPGKKDYDRMARFIEAARTEYQC